MKRLTKMPLEKSYTLHLGDCLQLMRAMHENSVDSIVCDPPYGLSFMGKKWDHEVPGVEVWVECLRVLKPGGHLLAFAGTRTQHRMAVRIEDAGFEIRDMIAWVYGSGFPKSLNVSKAIDKTAGVEREVLGPTVRVDGRIPKYESGNKPHNGYGGGFSGVRNTTAPATESAQQWQGWGTALKPSLEPITIARKPFSATVAANVLAHGTGAINIDGCRVERGPRDISGWSQSGSGESENRSMSGGNYSRKPNPEESGRWPANLIHDGSEEVLAGFPHTKSGAQKSHLNGSIASNTVASFSSGLDGKIRDYTAEASEGSAARFFYCAKASKHDRDAGLNAFEESRRSAMGYEQGVGIAGEGMFKDRNPQKRNIHPTVKPTNLMRYLCRLFTPPGGVVLDPFAGSGSTGKAAMLEGFKFIGCELNVEYFEIAKARIAAAEDQYLRRATI